MCVCVCVCVCVCDTPCPTDSNDQAGADEGPTASQGVVGSLPSKLQTIKCPEKETTKAKGEEEVYSIPSSPAREQGGVLNSLSVYMWTSFVVSLI